MNHLFQCHMNDDGSESRHISPYLARSEIAIITPVIHYCMGGLECTVDAECIDKSGKVIPGLYVAGEAAGGIHGNNRLGGNSLLDCVVFGRVAGKAACKFTFGKDEKFKPCPVPTELKELTK